jgi:hypothetical protein
VSAPRRIVAVNFHGIGTPERTLEPGEAPFWIGEDRFRDIVGQIAAHPARERIRITFDDGNRSDRAIALPVLQASGLRADFFVLTGRIGQTGSLDARGHPCPARRRHGDRQPRRGAPALEQPRGRGASRGTGLFEGRA